MGSEVKSFVCVETNVAGRKSDKRREAPNYRVLKKKCLTALSRKPTFVLC